MAFSLYIGWKKNFAISAVSAGRFLLKSDSLIVLSNHVDTRFDVACNFSEIFSDIAEGEPCMSEGMIIL